MKVAVIKIRGEHRGVDEFEVRLIVCDTGLPTFVFLFGGFITDKVHYLRLIAGFRDFNTQ